MILGSWRKRRLKRKFEAMTAGTQNTAVGYAALQQTAGTQDVLVGRLAIASPPEPCGEHRHES